MSAHEKTEVDEDIRISKIFGTFVAIPVLTVFGFYTGTVVGKPWVKDYQPADMIPGFYGAAVGAVLGVIVLITAVLYYSKVVTKDLEHEEAEHHH